MKIILSLIFSIWGLFAPESVVVDNSGGYFISNMGKLYVKDGNVLYQSKEKNEYILALVDPRGLYLNGKDLWIVDFDRLIKYDLSSKTYKSYFATFPRYLNDVTMYEGKIYVTDTYGNSVYILENDKLNVVFNVLRPNGITTDGKYLYVISFEDPAMVYKFSKEGVVESFALSDVKGGDGIFFADDLFFVSGYNSKNVVVYDKDWNKLLEKKGFSSPSDLYYKDGYLYVPDMKDGKIYVFQVKKEKK